MVKNRIHLLYISSLVVCALLFFGLGHFSYPLFHPSTPPRLSALEEMVIAGEDPADLQIFWQVWHLLERDFYGVEPDPEMRVYGVIRGLVASYNDPFTVYMEPPRAEERKDVIQGVHGAIGVTVEQKEEGYFLYPQADQPAALAGIMSGDQLIRIDGEPLPVDASVEAVEERLRGTTNTFVELDVLRGEGSRRTERSFRIQRVEIPTPNMKWRMLSEDAATASTGIITPTMFTENSANEMRTALAELRAAGADRILLDLRNNLGGTVESAMEIADMWIDSGLLLIERHQDGSETVIEAKPDGEAVDLPLIVLINGDTASASEMVAAALQDHGRAMLVGQRSFGKGYLQWIHRLPDQSSLQVTHAEWFTPQRKVVTKVGLTPDVLIEPGDDPIHQAVAILAMVAGNSPQVLAER
jgi:carboxyl-terminal processing protease